VISTEEVLNSKHWNRPSFKRIPMKSLEYIQMALDALDKEVESYVMDLNMDMTTKNEKMLPLLQQKRVLEQTKEDLIYLRDNPPSNAGECTMYKHR
jgi:hypothetical protein